MKYFFQLLVTIFFFTTACNKDKGDDPVEPEAAITISSPAANDTIMGTSFQVTGSITANTAIHGYEVKLLKQSDGTEVFSQDMDEHTSTFTINTTATPSGITEATTLRLVIDAVLDHEGNKTTKEVVFYYLP